MNISGHTKPYAVLGHPIGHSLSPVMHNASIRSLGLDAIYLAFDVHPDRLIDVLPAMGDMGFGGVNLTVPLKEVAYRGLDDLGDSAQHLGAVNTVQVLRNGGLRGHNTDGEGFMLAIREAFDSDVNGLSVAMIGVGGAGRAVAITCAVNGASRIALTDQDEFRTRQTAEEIGELAPDCRVDIVIAEPDTQLAAAQAADLVIQATPVGMKPDDPSLLPAEAFKSGQIVFDLVYMYPETSFMRTAREGGARAANGLGMLLHQGAHAFRIWTDSDPDVEAMRTALETAVYGESCS